MKQSLIKSILEESGSAVQVIDDFSNVSNFRGSMTQTEKQNFLKKYLEDEAPENKYYCG